MQQRQHKKRAEYAKITLATDSTTQDDCSMSGNVAAAVDIRRHVFGPVRVKVLDSAGSGVVELG